MKFETPETIENSTIKNLVTYFGHTNINARDLHRLSSDELMALSADGDILATRFFAPKISDVQEKPAQIPQGGFGWRKLVRLKAKAGSIAETNTKPKEYFVPDSCAQCHGGVRNRAKLNYLDTDHWVDRVTPAYGLADPRFAQEDFTALAQAPFGVLYDGGKDTTTSKFKNAFDVIRKLNEDIKTQNTDIGGGNNFQLAAVTKWLELHTPGASDNKHVPPHE